MYHIKIGRTPRTKIERYIDAYRSAFLELYDDTWLGYAEDIIKEQYIQNADLLRKVLYETIAHALSQEKIVGFSYSMETEVFLVTVPVERRRIFLSFREDRTTQTRILVDIEIVRK